MAITSKQTNTPWTLAPYTRIERTALQEQYGGRTQGGIGPSRKSPNVFIFSDPVAGEPHGYYDGWQADKCFHYTGEGQRGDQQMKSGNAAILNHAAEGRALRVFEGARGVVTYLDEFVLDEEEPFYWTDAPETGDGPLREVIVFRLRPMTIEPPPPNSKLAAVLAGPSSQDVPIEQQQTERAFVAPSHEPYEAERREQKLVLELEAHLRKLGHEVVRQRIVPESEARPLFTDLYDASTGTLVEAKGTVERGAIRMAIGQLVDYKRFVADGAPARLAVLLPKPPRPDLIDLLGSQGIDLIYPEDGGFVDSVGGEIVGGGR
ncbi:MAG: restriction endonuclease [Actinobacteria bacterium]|nr:MAG: restriction endonuclease [Actinomycetota bacterium]